MPSLARLEVTDGQEIAAGDPLVEGPRDPKELLEIKGLRETQTYLVEQVQRVYRDQGVSIHDKHIELIVRQMTRRVAVSEPGESDFLPGERVDRKVFRRRQPRAGRGGQDAGRGPAELMGITKASLATDSWLSAASFQETTRVLTEAAIESQSDSLLGLKENIIIGKLIPAGTGMGEYRDIDTHAPDYQPMAFYSSDADEGVDPAEWLADIEQVTATSSPTTRALDGRPDVRDVGPRSGAGASMRPARSRTAPRRDPAADSRGRMLSTAIRSIGGYPPSGAVHTQGRWTVVVPVEELRPVDLAATSARRTGDPGDHDGGLPPGRRLAGPVTVSSTRSAIGVLMGIHKLQRGRAAANWLA